MWKYLTRDVEGGLWSRRPVSIAGEQWEQEAFEEERV